MTGRPYSPTDLAHPLIRRLGETVQYVGPRGGRHHGVLANVHEDGTVTLTHERTGLVVAVVTVDRVRPKHARSVCAGCDKCPPCDYCGDRPGRFTFDDVSACASCAPAVDAEYDALQPT